MKDVNRLPNNVYVIRDILEIKDFHSVLDEFNYSFISLYKVEADEGTLDFLIQPKRFAVEKPYSAPVPGSEGKYQGYQGLGDSLLLISIGEKLKRYVEKILGSRTILRRVNTNLQLFGQESGFHIDCPPQHNHFFTLVIFIMDFWDISWGGEFTYQAKDGNYYMAPCIPNSGVLFPANLPHRGSAPNRLCREIRRSVAFTYEAVNGI